MVKKEFRSWVIVDAKSGKFRVLSPKTTLKQMKAKMKPTEIPIDLTMNIEVPEQPIMKAHGEIKLSQMEISTLVLSEMEEDDDPNQNI
jgi:hypothetical protein